MVAFHIGFASNLVEEEDRNFDKGNKQRLRGPVEKCSGAPQLKSHNSN